MGTCSSNPRAGKAEVGRSWVPWPATSLFSEHRSQRETPSQTGRRLLGRNDTRGWALITTHMSTCMRMNISFLPILILYIFLNPLPMIFFLCEQRMKLLYNCKHPNYPSIAQRGRGGRKGERKRKRGDFKWTWDWGKGPCAVCYVGGLHMWVWT